MTFILKPKYKKIKMKNIYFNWTAHKDGMNTRLTKYDMKQLKKVIIHWVRVMLNCTIFFTPPSPRCYQLHATQPYISLSNHRLRLLLNNHKNYSNKNIYKMRHQGSLCRLSLFFKTKQSGNKFRNLKNKLESISQLLSITIFCSPK